MSNASNGKRLDKIDRQLTPKQWAIRLADEMRQYASEEDFLGAIAKGMRRKSPITAPYCALAEQAQARWRGLDPENIRKTTLLDRKLRGEFHMLKTLIFQLNKTIKRNCELWCVKKSLQLSRIEAMCVRDGFAHALRTKATLIARCTTDNDEVAAHLQLKIKELSMHADCLELRITQLRQNWPGDAVTLLTEIVAYKVAIDIVQKCYFDDHPILFKDFEAALETTIQSERDVIVLFNDGQKTAGEPLTPEPDHKSGKNWFASGDGQSNLSISIDSIEERAKLLADTIVSAWIMIARSISTAYILEETGEHEDFVWKNFQKEFGTEQNDQEDLTKKNS